MSPRVFEARSRDRTKWSSSRGGAAVRSRVALVSAVALALVMALLVFVLFRAEPSTNRLADSPLLGKTSPALVGDTVIAGDHYDVIDSAGQWVLVNFFATWCIPCQAEHDDLNAFSNAHAASGDASVVSVVFSDDPDEVRAFFAENGGDWPVLADDDGRIATDWGVTGVPESYLVAPDGQVRAKIVGGIDTVKLEQLLADLKASSTP
jgi:cytochrome c biogenesis protein CcmG/thiol:disulfide interchange protein DsbE